MNHAFEDGSNSDDEWLAMVHALPVAARLGVRHVELLGDLATVMIDQARARGQAHHKLVRQLSVKA